MSQPISHSPTQLLSPQPGSSTAYATSTADSIATRYQHEDVKLPIAQETAYACH